MNNIKTNSREMVSTKHKSKVLLCSTPEHQADSPSRDSDSICDSDAASPVPFLCTQDGAEGLTDVVWNFYTPKSEHTAKSRQNSSPVSRRSKRSLRPKLIEKQVPKRRPIKSSQRKTELFQELLELNQDLHELIAKKAQSNTEKPKSGSEEDIFSDSPESSPKSTTRSNKHCLRKNVLSSKFTKPDPDAALESDDSMNECLIKASQIVEENILDPPSAAKKPRYDPKFRNTILKTDINFEMDHDSMDAILYCIKLESPIIKKTKKCDSPQLKNDSFDSFVGNLNDSALDRLTQMPRNDNKCKLNTSKSDHSWTIKELVVHDSPSSKSFGRHSSMPESPSVTNEPKPSTSGMVFGRYNSMPFEKDHQSTDPTDSPIRCTPDEIKKKHLLAREKLMAKRLLPFTASQKNSQSTLAVQSTQQPAFLRNKQDIVHNKFQPTAVTTKFQFKQAATAMKPPQLENSKNDFQQKQDNPIDIKSIIEKKRQEALMKLRRRQVPGKVI